MKKMEMKQEPEMMYSWFPAKDGSAIICAAKIPKGTNLNTTPSYVAYVMGECVVGRESNWYRLSGVYGDDKQHLNDIVSAINCIEDRGLVAVAWDGPEKLIYENKQDAGILMLFKLSIISVGQLIIEEDPEKGIESPIAKYIWLDNGQIIIEEEK